MFGSENIFFAPLKIMTNQKSPANFWVRFSGHGLLVMKSSAKDADQLLRLSTWLTDYALRITPKNAQGISQFLTLIFSLHFFWTMLNILW